MIRGRNQLVVLLLMSEWKSEKQWCAYHVDEAPDAGVAGVPEVARRLGDLDGEDGAGDGADAGAAQHSALRRQPDHAPRHRPDQRPHCTHARTRSKRQEPINDDDQWRARARRRRPRGAEHPAREATRRGAETGGAGPPPPLHLPRHHGRRRRRRVHLANRTRKAQQPRRRTHTEHNSSYAAKLSRNGS
uniref:Uncharacterized protein n=1 Tax=Oryza brachyantha TaxID=4533 RepID=J3N4K7_ORYBR